ncbi:MAG: hypothetical protein AAGA95_12245, partial [Pseudomonadota bacterium]
MWLEQRLSAAKDQPTSRFALQGAVNRMRALAMVVAAGGFTAPDLRTHFQAVQRRTVDQTADTLAFESLLMAWHFLAGLTESAAQTSSPYPRIRGDITDWYYATYFAARSMLHAHSASVPENHLGVASIWATQIAQPGLAVYPFSPMLPSLLKKDVDAAVIKMPAPAPRGESTPPQDLQHAEAIITSGLKGSVDYYRWRAEEDLKRRKEFKDLGVDDFRTAAARHLRDVRYQRTSLGYLHQAFRSRGKANYRDTLYLTYGSDYTTKLIQHRLDQVEVATAFFIM